MATHRLGNTSHYYVTDEIRYPLPPSEVCAAARSQLRGLGGLTRDGHDVLFDMMLEIEGVVRGGCDQWFGFSADRFTKENLVTLHELVRGAFLIKQDIPNEHNHDHTIVYFLSPGVVA